jgi:FtsZ-interacting cell division protein ZipA
MLRSPQINIPRNGVGGTRVAPIASSKKESAMNDVRLILVLAIVLVVVGVIVWAVLRSKRRARLRAEFGPEYVRTVKKYGSVTRAETALEQRRERVHQLDIQPVRPAEAERFAAAWRSAQARFVDDPRGAIAEADRLVQAVMEVRGYPVGDFEQRAEDVSVDHPRVVEHYRAAHQIATASDRGRVETEDLRQAMMHCRTLFQDLLEVHEDAPRRMEAGGR